MTLFLQIILLIIGVGGVIVSAMTLENQVLRNRLSIIFGALGIIGLVLTIIPFLKTETSNVRVDHRLTTRETNPFIGKWKLVNQSDLFCALMGNIELTEKLLKSPLSQLSYSLERDGKNYLIDTHEPGKNMIIPEIDSDTTMTLDLGTGIRCKFERISQ